MGWGIPSLPALLVRRHLTIQENVVFLTALYLSGQRERLPVNRKVPSDGMGGKGAGWGAA